MAVVYTAWAIIRDPDQSSGTPDLEWVGTVALLFTALMGALIAFYVGRVHSAQGGELPEDVLTADIDDGDPELGEFSPWSWWPIVLAFSAALGMIGSRGRHLAAADRLRCLPRRDRRLGLRVLPRILRALSRWSPCRFG